MITASRILAGMLQVTPILPAAVPPPVRSAQCWSGPEVLVVAREVSRRAGSHSWAGLMSPAGASEPDDLLTLLIYCYLAGVFHSAEVARRLQLDPALTGLREQLNVTTQEIRRFRRRQRRSLNDALTRALLRLSGAPEAAREGTANGLMHSRLTFHRLEPFYLAAQDRIDRAIILDSQALDD
ncbi:MAG: hypothetical protein ACKVYV_00490 [Limisphaerales bacterium]